MYYYVFQEMLAVNLTISIDNSIGKQFNDGVEPFGTSHSFQKRVML
jgi:hypothetical protein